LTTPVTETFFLPDEIDREDSHLPANLYNTAHKLLTRSEYDCVFVPIRNMQIFAVVTDHEVVFVDSLAYAHIDNKGGRVIQIAWQFKQLQDRTALDEPVACEVIYYSTDARQIQSRLIMEFSDALHQMDMRYRDEAIPSAGARIVAFRSNQND